MAWEELILGPYGAEMPCGSAALYKNAVRRCAPCAQTKRYDKKGSSIGLFPVPSRQPFRGSGKPPDATSRGRGIPGESPDRRSPGIPREIDRN
eukprot:scaffold16988_cov130-Skeletonema_marinoi.AAC.1